MVNTEDFGKRMQQIIDYYGISASTFADALGVGRSSISHILSGRNKPSLDFVTKITETYIEVDLYWLLYGKGSFPSIQNSSSSNKDVFEKKNIQKESERFIKTSSKTPNENLFTQAKDNSATYRVEKTKDYTNQVKNNESTLSKKNVQKVIIFYTDGTFDSYEKNIDNFF